MCSNIVYVAESDEEISLCFPAYKELRTHLTEEHSFIQQVRRQQEYGFKLIFIKNSKAVVACAGYRFLETLAWGKIIYIDDLVTKEEARGNGYGSGLLRYIDEQAKIHQCNEVHLDTGYHRHSAHRVYLRHGFQLNCHHFSKVPHSETIKD